MATNYIFRIKSAKTRFEAADLIRAFGCQMNSSAYGLSDDVRLKSLAEYERKAQSLERPYCIEDDVQCLESEHPWREWLTEWGF